MEWAQRAACKTLYWRAKKVTYAHAERKFDGVYHMGKSTVKHAVTSADCLEPRVTEDFGHTTNEQNPKIEFEVYKTKNVESSEVLPDNVAYFVDFQIYWELINIIPITSAASFMNGWKGKDVGT